MVHSSEDILKRLLDLHPKLIDLSLDRVHRLLAKLHHPEKKLPPVIHVAGTNGKGSVVATLRAIFEAAGFRVHCYTSPHLVHFHERIRLSGELISEDQLSALLEECERTNGGDPITFFEITTVVAFLAFSRIPADVVLLETGLGGRLDATNVVENPLITIITPIDMDHEHFLGDTIEKIAFEKACIMKPDVPCISAAQHLEAQRVLAGYAKEVGTTIAIRDQHWSVTQEGPMMVVQTPARCETVVLPSLKGAHQVENAALAVAALLMQSTFDIPVSAYNTGLGNIDWPARLQRLETGTLATLVGPDRTLWIDGGHNASAARALCTHIKNWGAPLPHIIVGMLKSREPHDFLLPFKALGVSVTFLAIPDQDNVWQPDYLQSVAKEMGLEATTAPDLTSAVVSASKRVSRGGKVVVTGSLYLCGHALRLNEG